MTPPRPQKTAQPYTSDTDNEPATGEHDAIATVGYVKRKEAEAEQKIDRSFKTSELRTIVGIAVVSIGTAFSVFFTLEARGQARVDAGVASVGERVTRNESRIEKVEHVAQTLALQGARTEIMVEMLVKARGLTPPPPVAADGGRP